MREAELLHHHNLEPVDKFTRLISVSIGSRGEAVATWKKNSTDFQQSGGADDPSVGIVTVETPHTRQVVQIEDFRVDRPTAQTLPDGRLLIVDKAISWSSGRLDHNASVYTSAGELELTAWIGDGVEHVRASADGSVWVGYNETGIYGDVSSDVSPGGQGLVCFSEELVPRWEFPGNLAHFVGDISSIDDCEALTLTQDSIWAYYYSTYTIVRVDDREVRSWRPDNSNGTTRAAGMRALATDGSIVALAGGHSDANANHLVTGGLTEQSTWTEGEAFALVLPDGRVPSLRANYFGLGDSIHAFVDRQWFKSDLHRIVSSQ